MSNLADWQRRFAKALTDSGGADVDLGQAQGLAVYRNNVRHGLIEALATAFPHTRTLLGERFFAAAAGDYVADQLPSDPRLYRYGHGLAEYLDGLPSLASYRHVSDICRLERARLDISHAADVQAFDADALNALQEDTTSAELLRLIPHPASRLVLGQHDVLERWQALERGEPMAPLGRGPTRWLMVRRDRRVELTPVSVATDDLYQALSAGIRLGEALASTHACHGQEVTGTAFGILLGRGALTRDAASRPGGSEEKPS